MHKEAKMTSVCRSAVAGARSVARSSSPKTLFAKPIPSSFSSSAPSLSVRSSRRIPPRTFRFPIGLACAESLMPLHSAIASARLKSILSTDSTCWGWLSQGLAQPL